MESELDGASGVLSLDEIFDVLVSRRRRAVLYELHGRSKPIELFDLAGAVDRLTGGANTEESPSGREGGTPREQIAVALEHVHLPKLQQAGLVEYDSTERAVKLIRIPEQFERYLRFAAEDEQRTDAIDATV